jgi:hypothetical protein
MEFRRITRLTSAVIAPLLAAGAVVAFAGTASASTNWHNQRVLFVSPSARPGNSDKSCLSAGFKKIQSAVNFAQPGSTVIVCPGTYHEQVVIQKPLSLLGKRATIDQTGVTPSFKVNLPPPLGTQTIYAAVVITSSRVSLSGFTITKADGEGVLAAGLSGPVRGITISRNAVVFNDQGFGVPPKSPYFQCAAAGEIPGDCGEGVHFAGNVAYSTIRGNFIAHNAGGVLLSDDVGPTHNNVVEGNVVTGNATDCGITVPGHNPGALNPAGVPQPNVAGVYRNVIKNNVVTNNGVKGEGAGVLFANAGPGTASYDNLVQGNYIEGNGLSGVTMHAHAIPQGQFEDLNGNVIIGNTIGENNLDGDAPDGPTGPSDNQTTGVLVYSGGVPVAVKIARNLIFDNEIGVWLSKPVSASGLRTNAFINVTTPVSANN